MKFEILKEGLLQAAQMPKQDLIGMFLPIVLVFGAFYFLLIRPQSKQQKEHKKMLENLKKGDKVQTVGGILATIVKVKDESVILKIDENSTLEVKKDSVTSIINASGKTASKEKEDAKDSKKEDAEEKDKPAEEKDKPETSEGDA